MRFDHTDFAEFYHKQMVESGYPGKLLPFVLSELKDLQSVLDIGSGTGFFSIPLAEAGHSVTAVEPSSEMINIMKKNTPAEIQSSIKICRTPWENWDGARHDAAISVHSLYPMPDLKKALISINESAARKIIIVRDSAGMRTLSGLVREKLGISSNRDLNSDIRIILNELNADWKSVNIHEERKHAVMDIEHEAEAVLFQLKLDDNCREMVFNAIKPEINNISGVQFFNAIYSDNAYIIN